MNDHPTSIINGGWWQTSAGLCLSVWSWLVGAANGLTIILTVLTIALTALKLWDAVRAWKATSGTVRERITQITKPADFDARPHDDGKP